MNTHTVKKGEIERKWYLVDAQDKVLGRLSSQIATVLRGKHKPNYSPHLDMGDFVVVINAEKVKVTGKKHSQKVYYHYSGYPGGLKVTPYSRLMEKKPGKVIEKAVWGMLPHNRLGRKLFRHLSVYSGAHHPHQAQKPEPLKLN